MTCRFVAVLLAAAALLVGCASAGRVDLERRPFVDPGAVEPSPEPELAARFSRETFVAADGARVPYRLLTPAAAASGARHAVVVALHGSGAIGDDNERQLGMFVRTWARPEFAASFPAFVVVPQAAARTANYEPDADGELASHPGAPLTAIVELAAAFAARPDVDPARIYLVGFSMGGSAALGAVTLRPHLFAAAVSFSGVAPSRALAPRAAGTPQLLVHGTADTENPIGPDRAWAAAVAAAGGTPRLIEYEGMDHRIPAELFTDASWRTWLFRQRQRQR